MKPELLGKHSPRWKQWLQLDKAATRRDLGLFMVEGPKLLAEAAAGHHRLRHVIFDPARWQPQPLGDARLWQVSPDMLDRLSQAETAQGVVGLVEPQPWPALQEAQRLLVAENIADPGNLGTLLRSAWAAGVDGVASVGGADPHSPKSVRASAGAVFHLPVWTLGELGQLPPLPRIGLTPHAAGNLYQLQWPTRWALLVGSEAHGLSREALSSLDLTCTIPTESACESLNAAVSAAIALFEWRRRSQETCAG